MTCRQARKHLADLFDPAASHEVTREVHAHITSCGACAAEYDSMQTAFDAATPDGEVRATDEFKQRVLNRLATDEPAPLRRRLFVPRFAFIAIAAVVLVVLAPFLGSLGGKRGKTPASVLTLLAQSAEAMSGLRSVHISARMRTLPADNFEYIDAQLDWVPLEIWREFGTPPKWRVEKPGRVAVMDGTSSVLFMRPDQAARGGPRPGFLEWLRLLLDPDKVMESELRTAQAGLSTASLSETDRDGSRQWVLTVDRRAGGASSDDWLRDKTVSASDHTRVYRFDAASKRLEGLLVVLHSRTGDVPVFEIARVQYNESLDPALFTLSLPADVAWMLDAAQMPVSSRGLPQSPKEAAEVFFDGLAREDWNDVESVYPYGLTQGLKTWLGGLHVVSIGEPFQSFFYPGWFVPYEIRLKSGRLRKHNLAVRNDNPERRWVFDGGL